MPTPTITFSPAGLRRKQCSRGKRDVIGSIPIAGLRSRNSAEYARGFDRRIGHWLKLQKSSTYIFLSHIFLLAKLKRENVGQKDMKPGLWSNWTQGARLLPERMQVRILPDPYEATL